MRGRGIWKTAEAERRVDTAGYLVLNAGHPYSITIDSREMVETFCLFFRPGFVEDVLSVERSAPAALLDAPDRSESPDARLDFFETLHPHDREVSPVLQKMHARIRAGAATPEWLEDEFFRVAQAMLSIRCRTKKQAARVPVKKLSTRLELYKRLLRGKDFLESFHAEAVQLNHAARAACLSPYHFHRLFREVFGETPNQFLQRKRLARARELLRTTDFTITRITLDVGFDSSTSFSTLFRRHFGCSPREFRSLFFPEGRSPGEQETISKIE